MGIDDDETRKQRKRAGDEDQYPRSDELLHQARLGLAFNEHPGGHADADDKHHGAHQPRDIS